MAVESEETETTDKVRDKCSVKYDPGVEGCIREDCGGSSGVIVNAFNVGGSQSSVTLLAKRALATLGQTVLSNDSCTIRVSTALQAAG